MVTSGINRISGIARVKHSTLGLQSTEYNTNQDVN